VKNDSKKIFFLVDDAEPKKRIITSFYTYNTDPVIDTTEGKPLCK
jgi:hypothetical protein